MNSIWKWILLSIVALLAASIGTGLTADIMVALSVSVFLLLFAAGPLAWTTYHETK